ncbi:MAG: hypothetical protein IPN86_19020 [Saprospiraceae bacterium]|nr:hypothetical protein [Saprospiraceae bacterium]
MLYKFKFKILIWSILTLLFTNGYGQPPGNGTPPADTPKDIDLDYVPPSIKPKCYTLVTKVPLSINKDCPTGNLDIKVVSRALCPENCRNPIFRTIVRVGFITIFNGTIKDLGNSSIPLSSFMWDLLQLITNEPGPLNMNIRIIMVCDSGEELELYNEVVPSYIHGNGDLRPELYYVITHTSNSCPPPGNCEKSVCCDSKHIINSTISSVSSINSADNFSNGSNVTATVGFNLDVSTFELTFPIPLGSKNMFNNIQYSLYNTTESSVSLSITSPGTGCNYAGISMIYDEFKLVWIRSNCFGLETIDNSIPPEQVFYNAQFYPTICNKPSSLNCTKPNPKVKFNNNFRFFIACSGTIVLESKEVPSNQFNIIYWTDPTGNITYGNDVSGPFGEYKLTIENECCEKFEYNYYLCSETINLTWLKNSNGKW